MAVTVQSKYQVTLSQRQLNILVDLLNLGPDTDNEMNTLFDELEPHATEGGLISANQDPQVVGPLWDY